MINRKENIISGVLFIIAGILITFFLNTATMIIALFLITVPAIYDCYKKPALAKILFYIIVFGAFSVYLVFYI
ncbi:hypothetical protein [Oceanobacillus aidingensis]|uniref:Uncharacterized protein n=1 Tax=Oceanobacillus aidingensis TaxID=645964 RepID=A0ABV9JU55_9BACI